MHPAPSLMLAFDALSLHRFFTVAALLLLASNRAEISVPAIIIPVIGDHPVRPSHMTLVIYPVPD